MIYILNRDENIVSVLSKSGGELSAALLSEYLYKADTLEFTVSTNDVDTASTLVEENYAVLADKDGKHKVFTIREVIDEHSDKFEKRVFAECVSTELVDFICTKDYSGKVTDIRTAITEVLSGTRWTVGEITAPPENLTPTFDTVNNTVLGVIQDFLKLYSYQIDFRVEFDGNNIVGRKVYVKPCIGSDKGRRFEYTRDINVITREVTAGNLKTAAILIGGVIQPENSEDIKEDAEPINIVDISWTSSDNMCTTVKGSPYIEVKSATDVWGYKNGSTTLPRMTVLVDNRFLEPVELAKYGYEMLKPLLFPQINYKMDVQDLFALTDDPDYSGEEVYKGDVVTVIDKEIIPEIIIKANVISKKTDLINTENVEIELGTELGNFTNSTVTYPQLQGMASGLLNQMGVVTATTVTTKVLEAELAIIDELIVNLVKADEILANKITATEGNFEILNAEVGNIKNLVSGNISSDNIQTGGITGDNLNMNTVFIKDANIIDLSASKIDTGELNTSKVVIASDDGGMKLIGATQQFLDKNNRIRIQLGKDNKGDFDFYILAENGDILFNTRGITGNAIEQGLIKEDMVSDGAIGGKKINWSSFATEFNSATNTTTLNSSKIMLDGTGQTLDVHFNKLSSTVDGVKETTESNTTQLNVHQGKINALIQDTTIIKDGKELKLKDEYSRLEQTVGGIKTTVGTQGTTIDQHTGKITATENKVSTIEQNVNSITQRVSSTETNVSNQETRLSAAEQKITPTAIINSVSSSINDGSGKIDTVTTTLDKNGFTVKNGAITIKNKANEDVLKGDTEGNLMFTGSITNFSPSGSYGINISRGDVSFTSASETTSKIVSTSAATDRNINGLSISSTNSGEYIDIADEAGIAGGQTEYKAAMRYCAKENSTLGDSKLGFNFWKDVHTYEYINAYRGVYVVGSGNLLSAVNTLVYGNVGGYLGLSGANGVSIGIRNPDNTYTALMRFGKDNIAKESKILLHSHINFNGWSVKDVANVYVQNTQDVNYPHRITSTTPTGTSGGHLGVYGDNGATLGYQAGTSLMSRLAVTETSFSGTNDQIRSWGNWDFNGWTLHNVNLVRSAINTEIINKENKTYTTTTPLASEGNKTRFVYKDIQLKNNQAILSIPKRFAGDMVGYTVTSIVKKGKGDVWVSVEKETLFIIEGDTDIRVNVEVEIEIDPPTLCPAEGEPVSINRQAEMGIVDEPATEDVTEVEQPITVLT